VSAERLANAAGTLIPVDRPTSVTGWQEALSGERYLADRGLATAIHLAISLDKPLLLEGEAGVGKTEVAKVLASLLGRELIRLQCYEGIDASRRSTSGTTRNS